MMMKQQFLPAVAAALVAACASAAQLDHWEYDAGTGVINDGVFAFDVNTINANKHTLRVLSLNTAWMEANCDAATPQPLDFSKPVVIDGVDYDVTDICPTTQAATNDNCIPEAWRWLPGSLVLNPSTTRIGQSFCYGSTNLSGRLVIPATLTSIPQNFCRGKAANAVGRVKLQEVVFQGPCNVTGNRAFESCSFTNIVGSQYIRKLGSYAFLKAGSSVTPLDLSGLTDTTIPLQAFGNFTSPYTILPDTITSIAGLQGCVVTNFPPASLTVISVSGNTVPGGLSAANPDGVVVFPEGFTTTPTLTTAQTAHYGPFANATGIVRADFPESYTAITGGLFANCVSIEKILFRATQLTQLGIGAFNAANLREIRFLGAPPPAADIAEFLGSTKTTGGATYTRLKANQVTLFVLPGTGWEALADGGVIPGTITAGTTQNIRYWGGLVNPTMILIR